MKIKIIGIFIVMLMILIPFSMSASAGSEEDPEIEDETGDAFGYIDIVSVWYYEKEETPDFLYVSMKINEPSESKFQQTFAAFWTFKNVQYSVSLHLGFSFKNWSKYGTGFYRGRSYINNKIDGIYDYDTGIITWAIPKDFVGNPQQGDVLTDTWSNAFRRLGFIGRIGLTRHVLNAIILQVFGNYMWDYAPERGEYGRDYVIQYL